MNRLVINTEYIICGHGNSILTTNTIQKSLFLLMSVDFYILTKDTILTPFGLFSFFRPNGTTAWDIVGQGMNVQVNIVKVC